MLSKSLSSTSTDYYFVTREEMLKAIQNDEFIEHTEFSGNIYGTRWEALVFRSFFWNCFRKPTEFSVNSLTKLHASNRNNLLPQLVLSKSLDRFKFSIWTKSKWLSQFEFISSQSIVRTPTCNSKKAIEDVRSKGKICILDIEIEGVKNVKKSHLNPVYIFIKPPTINELVSLIGRRSVGAGLERKRVWILFFLISPFATSFGENLI